MCGFRLSSDKDYGRRKGEIPMDSNISDKASSGPCSVVSYRAGISYHRSDHGIVSSDFVFSTKLDPTVKKQVQET